MSNDPEALSELECQKLPWSQIALNAFCFFPVTAVIYRYRVTQCAFASQLPIRMG